MITLRDLQDSVAALTQRKGAVYPEARELRAQLLDFAPWRSTREAETHWLVAALAYLDALSLDTYVDAFEDARRVHARAQSELQRANFVLSVGQQQGKLASAFVHLLKSNVSSAVYAEASAREARDLAWRKLQDHIDWRPGTIPSLE